MHKVVIADDSRSVRIQLRRALSGAGFEVSEATTGVEAVQRICAERPVVAILDINMPELDGYGVCQKLQEIGSPWDRIPIVFLTSIESHALEVLGHQLGAYLHKPTDDATLVSTVQSLVPLAV